MTTLRSLVVLIVLLASIGCAWAGTEKALYDFAGGNDGADPEDYGRLARDSSGNLFGTTDYGGTCNYGTIFRLDYGAGGWTETVLYSFCGGSNGGVPVSAVILDNSGNIYGTAAAFGSAGCGTVFELSGTTLQTLHAFTCGSDGGNPITGLIRDSHGNLYGTTPDGGTNGWGVVYEISSSGTFSVLHAFCPASGCADGAHPSGGLVRDRRGNLYGTTLDGGDWNCGLSSQGCGVVFELSRVGNTWSETVLHRFSGEGADGALPAYASLTLVEQKINNAQFLVLYGVTLAGGDFTDGTVFQMTQRIPSSSLLFSFEGIHSFCDCFSDGGGPVGTLTLAKGRLFGTTRVGGTGDSGTVFQLSQQNQQWTETVLYNFVNGQDGGHPYSGVVADSGGALYGVASSDGGAFGAVYQVTP